MSWLICFPFMYEGSFAKGGLWEFMSHLATNPNLFSPGPRDDDDAGE